MAWERNGQQGVRYFADAQSVRTMKACAILNLGKCRAVLIGLLLVFAGSGAAMASSSWVFEDVERVVAIGDVHGASEELKLALRGAGVIDADLRWTGGKTHLVSVGDLLDRGAESRKVMDLLIRLQAEAAAAGGRVHVVPGNHEIMNLTDDLRYVAAGEYAAFAGDETKAERDEAFARWRSAQDEIEVSTELQRAQFDATYPAGFFAHRKAFSPQGRYGRWIESLPFFVRVNDTLFVHGGLSERMAEMSGDALNRAMQDSLVSYREATRTLTRQGLLPAFADYGERFEFAQREVAAAADDEGGEGPEAATLQALSDYLALEKSLIFATDGPLWYRGNAWCHPQWESIRLQAALANLGARRVVVGHTPTPLRRITTRLDGRVIMIDTGMLPYYSGRPAALEITADGMRAYYADEGRWLDPETELRALGARPARMSDADVEMFLTSAEIIQSEELGMGITRPLRLTFSQDGVTLRGVFKGEDTDTRGGTGTRRDYRLNLADSYKHDVAAYRLDKFLGINLIPVTIEREFDGREGSIQFWVENSVSELERREQNIPIYSACDLEEQYDLMRVFDVLIYNEDRNQSNLLFDRDDGMLRLIDHSRSFRTHRGRPAFYENARLRMPEALAKRLRALDREVLHELVGGLLNRKQIRALLKRRDEIMDEAEVVSGRSNAKGIAD